MRASCNHGTGAAMKRFFTHWVTVGLSLWVATVLVPGISVQSVSALAVGALVLGLINALVRPVLMVLTLPITLLTLGLFYLVVNGMAFGLAAWFVPGFGVSGLGSAIGGALVVAICSWFIGLFVDNDRERERDD